jgi:hypothetical protein
VALLLMTVGMLASGSEARAAGGGLGECGLVEDAGTAGFVGLSTDTAPQPLGDGCGYAACRIVSAATPYAPARCVYGRKGVVVRARAATAARARGFVRKALRKLGYQEVRVGADLAAIATSQAGGIVVLAVRRVTIVYALGAYSDKEGFVPSWNAGGELKEGARTIAAFLRSNSDIRPD